jgi:hypothetical protein
MSIDHPLMVYPVPEAQMVVGLRFIAIHIVGIGVGNIPVSLVQDSIDSNGVCESKTGCIVQGDVIRCINGITCNRAEVPLKV